MNFQSNKINLLEKEDNVQPKGRKIFKVSKFIIYLFVLLALTFFIFTYQVLFTQNSFVDSLGGKLNIFKQLTTMASGDNNLAGSKDDRINILLLGMGGLGHDGPYLTDTIMVASVEPSTNKVSMISVPRDLLVEIPGHNYWKINNANHFGEKANPNHGGELVQEVVSKTLGIPIHYYVRVDFAGFEKLIDDLGGVKVFVDRSFDDFEYPTKDHKYQHLSFTKGWNTMDGDTALKYVRSRHGNNGEGSDFSRSKRQQKVLQAFKERVLSYNTFLNPRKLNKLLQAFGNHVTTNLEIPEMVEMAKLAKKLDTQNIITQVLDDRPDGYLYAGTVNGAYVLQPKGGDFSQIQYLAKNIFVTQHVIENKPSATIEIKNGTKTSGLAYNSSIKLKSLGFKVLKIGNAPTQDYTSTVIYDLAEEYDEQSANIINSQFKTPIKNTIPDWVREDADLATHYYIILGDDAQN